MEGGKTAYNRRKPLMLKATTQKADERALKPSPPGLVDDLPGS
jgi:hypothetical protein